MMERVLADLDSRGVSTVELHANPEAVEFYAPFSFKKLDDISFFAREPPLGVSGADGAASGAFSWLSPGDAPFMAKAMSSALDYDGGDTLEALTKSPPYHALSRTEDGRSTALITSRVGHDLNAAGPWIMERPGRKAAEGMMREFLSRAPAKRVDVLAMSSSEVAGPALEACGFSLAKAGLVRLVRSSGHVARYPESVLCIGHLCLI
jgi:hypothetical protein